MVSAVPLNIAFVGSGWIVRTVWLPLLREAGARIVAAVDPDPAALTSLAALVPGLRTHAALSGVALDGCDVAFICSPNSCHVEQALQVLALGRHVVVEKPACFSVPEAERLIAASRAAQRALMVTSASSHRGDTAQLLAAARAGTLGQVQCIDASWRRRAGIPRLGSWFTDERLAIGGSGADLGWHLLEVALGALDFPLVTDGQSRTIRPFGPAAAMAQQHAAWREDGGTSAASIDVDTQLFASLRTANGALVRLTTAWSSAQPSDETALTLYGSEGEMRLLCTFGFSPNHSGRHELTLLRDGAAQALPCGEERMLPYCRFVASMLAYLAVPWRDDNAETQRIQRQLRSLGSAMALLYPQPLALPAVMEAA
jgi:oxidoreductase